jgi:hypothetical protein
MNAITERFDPSPSDFASAGAETFTLRRTGRKAVRFDGWHLVEATCDTGNRPVTHDLNIYRTVKDGIVVELIVRQTQLDQKDIAHVQTFPSLTEAASWLESYRAADDMPVPADLNARETALPWAVLQAVQLRQAMERAESDYRSMLTEVFAALDLTDTPEPASPPHG